MTKISDQEILRIKLLVEAGETTVKAECDKLGIRPQTYYKRRDHLLKTVENVENALAVQAANIPVTLEAIQGELNAIIITLKGLETTTMREQLQVIDRQIQALRELGNTLKTSSIIVGIDARQQSVNVGATGREAIIAAWCESDLLPILARYLSPEKMRELGRELQARFDEGAI